MPSESPTISLNEKPDKAGKTTCSLMDLLNVLPSYRAKAFAHGNAKLAAFHQKMTRLFIAAANDVLAKNRYELLGPRDSKLVFLKNVTPVDAEHFQLDLRELVGTFPTRMPDRRLKKIDAMHLVEHHVALLWPGHDVPLSLAPFLHVVWDNYVIDVYFLNDGIAKPQIKYLSYCVGEVACSASEVNSPEVLLKLVNACWRPDADSPSTESAASASTRPGSSASGSQPAAATPLVDYQVLGRLGRGGMGVVYLAWQRSLQRWIALKQLPFKAIRRPRTLPVKRRRRRLLKGFHREIQHLARCQHPNIVKLLQRIETPDGKFYCAMEYVPGANLMQVWREVSHGRASTPMAELDGQVWTRAVYAAACQQWKRTKQTRPESRPATFDQADTGPAAHDATRPSFDDPAIAPEAPAASAPWPPEPECPTRNGSATPDAGWRSCIFARST